jgi:P-type Ca2+ transporter type 2C
MRMTADRERIEDGATRVELIHQISGRARFRVPALRKDRRAAFFLQRELLECPGIRQITVSAITATVLVRFVPGRPAAGIADWIRKVMAQATPQVLAEYAPADGQTGRWVEKTLQPWHTMGGKEILRHFDSSADEGLSAAVVEERRSFFGDNRLPGTASRSLPAIWKSQVTSLPVVLTGVAALLAGLTGGVAEGALALTIALLNAAIGALTENRSERILDTVRESVDLRAWVIRSGQREEIAFNDVVPGDLLELQPGARIPADAYLLEAEHLSVDESALTGESIPVHKHQLVHSDASLPISRRPNMLFRGTLVVEGRGRAVVVATGGDTILGRLQGFLGAVFPPEALVARDIRMLLRRCMLLGLGAAGIFSIAGLLRGHGLLNVLRGGLALVAGSVPVGLSTLALSAFALGHRDLRQHHVLVRRLRALGNLATAQVVCFDKTGTLTRNRMTVSELYAGMRTVKLSSKDFLELGKPPAFMGDRDMAWMLSLATLCNEAFMVHEGAQSLEGSSTEKALIRLSERAGINSTSFRGDHPILEIRHRTEAHPFMITLHHWTKDKELAVMKGSPHEVLERCGFIHRNGQCLPLDETERSRIEAENFRMSGAGLRVLGIAYQWEPNQDVEALATETGRWVWIGLIGLADPVRRGAREVVQGLHRAGIRTAVITGDQSLTAHYIGEELGIAGGEPLRILDAMDLSSSLEGLRSVVTRTHVFARLSPTQKLQIIQAYQSAGMNVVMVGDGFNDILALKVADVGIAMGREGAELARRTADLVLEDDDLGNVLRAIANGRAFYGNMHRSLLFVLASSHMDILADLLSRSGFGGRGPNPLQSLWGSLACLALALEPAAVDGNDRPPAADALISPKDMQIAGADALKVLAATGVTAGYGLGRYGLSAETDRLLWSSHSINQLLYAFACREANGGLHHPPHRLLQAVFWAVAGGHLVATLLTGGPGRGLFNALALGVSAWLSRILVKPQASAQTLPNESFPTTSRSSQGSSPAALTPTSSGLSLPPGSCITSKSP